MVATTVVRKGETMHIGPITIERGDAASFCGLLTVGEGVDAGHVWWSVERLDATRVRVGFVQGEQPDWLDLVERHAPALSDAILEAIANRPRLAAVA
jgi:hypothetical protein